MVTPYLVGVEFRMITDKVAKHGGCPGRFFILCGMSGWLIIRRDVGNPET